MRGRPLFRCTALQTAAVQACNPVSPSSVPLGTEYKTNVLSWHHPQIFNSGLFASDEPPNSPFTSLLTTLIVLGLFFINMTIDERYDPYYPNHRICCLMENNHNKCKELITYFKEELKLTCDDLTKAKDMNEYGEDFGLQPLHVLMMSCNGEGCLELAQYLADLCPALLEKPDYSGNLPIHQIPARVANGCEYQLEARIWLMKQYPEGLKVDGNGTPLARAISYGKKRITMAIANEFPHLLRDSKSCVMMPVEHGKLPFNYALDCKENEIATMLLELYPEAIKFSLAGNDEILSLLIGSVEEDVREKSHNHNEDDNAKCSNADNKIPDWKQRAVVCVMERFRSRKEAAVKREVQIQHEIEQTIKQLARSEDSFLSTIKSKWPASALSAVIKAVTGQQQSNADSGSSEGEATKDELIATIKSLFVMTETQPRGATNSEKEKKILALEKESKKQKEEIAELKKRIAELESSHELHGLGTTPTTTDQDNSNGRDGSSSTVKSEVAVNEEVEEESSNRKRGREEEPPRSEPPTPSIVKSEGTTTTIVKSEEASPPPSSSSSKKTKR